jgi:MoxR-like ATPase
MGGFLAFDFFQKVSRAPTNPRASARAREFDVADLYRGPVADAGAGAAAAASRALDEKLRQAYFWIVNQAIISPHYDIEYNDGPPQTFVVGDS